MRNLRGLAFELLRAWDREASISAGDLAMAIDAIESARDMDTARGAMRIPPVFEDSSIQRWRACGNLECACAWRPALPYAIGLIRIVPKS